MDTLNTDVGLRDKKGARACDFLRKGFLKLSASTALLKPEFVGKTAFLIYPENLASCLLFLFRCFPFAKGGTAGEPERPPSQELTTMDFAAFEGGRYRFTAPGPPQLHSSGKQTSTIERGLPWA
jgi:hypothetical protein